MAILIEIPAAVKSTQPTFESDRKTYEKPIEIQARKVRNYDLAYAKVEQFEKPDIPAGVYKVTKFIKMVDEEYRMNSRFAVRHIPSKIVMVVPYGQLYHYSSGSYEVVVTNVGR
jgi:hypothetical protein